MPQVNAVGTASAWNQTQRPQLSLQSWYMKRELKIQWDRSAKSSQYGCLSTQGRHNLHDLVQVRMMSALLLQFDSVKDKGSIIKSNITIELQFNWTTIQVMMPCIMYNCILLYCSHRLNLTPFPPTPTVTIVKRFFLPRSLLEANQVQPDWVSWQFGPGFPWTTEIFGVGGTTGPIPAPSSGRMSRPRAAFTYAHTPHVSAHLRRVQVVGG